jgi:hypothetical protein
VFDFSVRRELSVVVGTAVCRPEPNPGFRGQVFLHLGKLVKVQLAAAQIELMYFGTYNKAAASMGSDTMTKNLGDICKRLTWLAPAKVMIPCPAGPVRK